MNATVCGHEFRVPTRQIKIVNTTRTKRTQEGQKGALGCGYKKFKIDPETPLLEGTRAPLSTPGPGSATCRRAISARLRERSSCCLAQLRAEVRAGGYAWSV